MTSWESFRPLLSYFDFKGITDLTESSRDCLPLGHRRLPVTEFRL